MFRHHHIDITLEFSANPDIYSIALQANKGFKGFSPPTLKLEFTIYEQGKTFYFKDIVSNQKGNGKKGSALVYNTAKSLGFTSLSFLINPENINAQQAAFMMDFGAPLDAEKPIRWEVKLL